VRLHGLGDDFYGPFCLGTLGDDCWTGWVGVCCISVGSDRFIPAILSELQPVLLAALLIPDDVGGSRHGYEHGPRPLSMVPDAVVPTLNIRILLMLLVVVDC
jgi:hypothetical protein